MIESLQISNFRGYRNLSLDRLPRFNFVVGPSASGKTAFLEALWIVGGTSPEIYFRMRAMRGVSGQIQILGEKEPYESFFSDIFSTSDDQSGSVIGSDHSPVARIDIFDSTRGHRSLTFSYGNQEELQLQPQDAFMGRGTIVPRRLIFTWKIGDKEYPCPLVIKGNQIVLSQAPEIFPSVLITSSQTTDAGQNAQRLSEFRIRKKGESILKAIRQIYPQVLDLSPEVSGGQQMVYAELTNVDKRLPIQVVSSGINKYLSLILAISHYRGGVVLIDEIENGFYFRDYEKVIVGLAEFCLANEVQLFVTTHSNEMLEAVNRAMKGKESELAILRTISTDEGCSIALLPGDEGRAAISEGIELR